ncbi:MAG: twin-arginine translocase TatA/TatE family subunit [Lachnospiraceae bacterium]|nr:twin-arginine translocase TatA/TatE family subunit [Lachnospiraceae bacterium]
MRIGQTELLIILAVVVIIFGPTQIPKLTKMFGKSVKNFREGMGDDESSSEKKEKSSEDDSKE